MENLDTPAILLFEAIWSPPNVPEPANVKFSELEKRFSHIINEIWELKDVWNDSIDEFQLYDRWAFQLRIMVMYLNMSDAFYRCGTKFMEEAINEDSFINKYQNIKRQSKIERASFLLARIVKILKMIGFKNQMISISGDLHYYGKCLETKQIINNLSSLSERLN